MKWRILPSSRKYNKERVQAILARNSGTPVAIIQYADLMRLFAGTQETPQLTPVMH